MVSLSNQIDLSDKPCESFKCPPNERVVKAWYSIRPETLDLCHVQRVETCRGMCFTFLNDACSEFVLLLLRLILMCRYVSYWGGVQTQYKIWKYMGLENEANVEVRYT